MMDMRCMWVWAWDFTRTWVLPVAPIEIEDIDDDRGVNVWNTRERERC
jgi:hypothetical protein